jgi:hypothetical protein
MPQAVLQAGMMLSQRLNLPVTAIANTDFTMSIPPGCTLLSAVVYTSVAYTGATVTIQLGSSAGDSSYVAAISIKAVGMVPLHFLPRKRQHFFRCRQGRQTCSLELYRQLQLLLALPHSL